MKKIIVGLVSCFLLFGFSFAVAGGCPANVKTIVIRINPGSSGYTVVCVMPKNSDTTSFAVSSYKTIGSWVNDNGRKLCSTNGNPNNCRYTYTR